MVRKRRYACTWLSVVTPPKYLHNGYEIPDSTAFSWQRTAISPPNWLGRLPLASRMSLRRNIPMRSVSMTPPASTTVTAHVSFEYLLTHRPNQLPPHSRTSVWSYVRDYVHSFHLSVYGALEVNASTCGQLQFEGEFFLAPRFCT